MPVKILVAAQQLAPHKPGEIVAAMDGSYIPGNRETLPKFIWIDVPDATKEQVDGYLASWMKFYEYTIDSENSQRYTVSMRVDPSLISAAGLNADIRDDLETYLLAHEQYTITTQNKGSTFLTVQVEKPALLSQLRDEINDLFGEIADFRRYYFSSEDVATAIAAGGNMTLSRSFLQSRIIDRMADSG